MVGRLLNDTDRLSEMPDEILHHIISFGVHMEQVIQMCLLSKRWRNLWRTLPTLFFNFQGLGCKDWESEKFQHFIDHILLLRETQVKINKFSLAMACFSPNEHFISQAISLNAAQVVELSLTWSSINFTSNFDHLKTLQLKYVSFCERSAKKELFLSLPIAEELVIEDCCFDGIEILKISASLLRDLMIKNVMGYGNTSDCHLGVYAPNLRSLVLKGRLYKDYFLANLPSLSTAEIQIDYFRITKEVFLRCMKKLLVATSNVKSLTQSASIFQVFASLPTVLKQEGNAFHNLKVLKLTEWHTDGHIVALARLLINFPAVETLVLERTQETFDPKMKKTDWRAALSSIRCKLVHLKTVEVRNIYWSENEYTVLHFLLKNASSLENLIVETSMHNKKELVEFSNTLNLLSEASSSVKNTFMVKGEVILILKSHLLR